MSDKEKLDLYNEMVSQRNTLMGKIIAEIDACPLIGAVEVCGLLDRIKMFIYNRTKNFDVPPFEGDYISEDFKVKND